MIKPRKWTAMLECIIFSLLLMSCIKNPEMPESGNDQNSTANKNPYEYEVIYLIPEGINDFSSSDDSVIYYNEDETEIYTAWVWTCYDDLEQYLLSRYSECRTVFPDNSEISSMPAEEIIGNHTVKYITVSYTKRYEEEIHTYQHIYAGVYLQEGILFEIEAETMDDEGDFNFDKLRPFFEELKVQKQSET